MSYESASPCRHRGAPSDQVVEQVIRLLSESLPNDRSYLAAHGLAESEYQHALGSAIERLRGRTAASNQNRRKFVDAVVKHMVDTGVVARYDRPKYGDDTVYRLYMDDGKQVGVVQKGCPDGSHSSVNWSRPEWADELYLWWVCDSKRYEPGEHVWKGVSRVRGKVSQDPSNQLDGVIFYNRMCGTIERPCPKSVCGPIIDGRKSPPPCVYVFPTWDPGSREMNRRGEIVRSFPSRLLRAFGVPESDVSDYVGFVGFRVSGQRVSTEVTSRFGQAKSTSARG